MSWHHDFRLQCAQNFQLFEHPPGRSVTVVGPDVGMPADIADEAGVHDSALWQPHGNIAWIVGIIDIDKLNGLAADMKRHAIRKADNGIKRPNTLERFGPFGESAFART